MFLFYQFFKILFQKYWYYLNNTNTDRNQPAFQGFFLIIKDICFAADSNVVLERCLNRTDQARNTMKEMTSIYSS